MRPSPAADPFRLIDAGEVGEATLAAQRIEAGARMRFAVAQALVQGRMTFHFQPVVRADRPGFPAFFEMLARMQMPTGEVIGAGAFLPQIEKGPLGRIIDRLALSEALAALADDPTLRLSVNMSPLSMGDEEWLGILAAAHRGGTGVCGRLILEITETAAMDDAAQTIDFMDHVRRMGPTFAIDDFGAGTTGFRHFRDFRFDMVKIDGSFTDGVHRSPDKRVLMECLMRLAQHFEMITVAERVEDQADATWLRDAGVDCLQGYLYGRPAGRAEMPPATGSTPRSAAG